MWTVYTSQIMTPFVKKEEGRKEGLENFDLSLVLFYLEDQQSTIT